MKKLRYYIIACTASLAFLTACDNAEYNVIDNAIYLEEPSLSASNNTKLTVDGEVVQIIVVVGHQRRVYHLIVFLASLCQQENESQHT